MEDLVKWKDRCQILEEQGESRLAENQRQLISEMESLKRHHSNIIGAYEEEIRNSKRVLEENKVEII
jgi:hypothetical protein